RTEEAHRQQQQIAGNLETAVGDLLELAGDERDAARLQTSQRAVSSQESLGHHPEVARTAFVVGARRAKDERPGRPGVRGKALVRRSGQKLERGHRSGSLPMASSHAV